MISLKQIRNFLITIGLAIMLAITIAFDFGTSGSWAATSLKPSISEPQTQIATTKGVENTVQDAQASMGIMAGSGDSKDQSATKTEAFNAKTLEGINNSIGNPNYKPGGKTQKAEKQERNATKDIKAEASEAMDSYQGGDRHSYQGRDRS